MSKRIDDARLPNGVYVVQNSHGEYVACDRDGVIFFDRDMIAAADNLEDAVQNYLKRVVHR